MARSLWWDELCALEKTGLLYPQRPRSTQVTGSGISVTMTGQAKPDMSAVVWKLRSTRARYSEVWTIKQSARDIRIRMDIKDDRLGDRVLDFEAPFDGRERVSGVCSSSY